MGLLSPDSSGILLWRFSPQEIERMAGGRCVANKMGASRKKENNDWILKVVEMKKPLQTMFIRVFVTAAGFKPATS